VKTICINDEFKLLICEIAHVADIALPKIYKNIALMEGLPTPFNSSLRYVQTCYDVTLHRQ
jgi:hypothetical protein